MSDVPKVSQSQLGVRIRTLFIFVFLVIGLQLLGAYLQIHFLHSWSDRSAFGEMFGSINTLFSGLAFAGVIYTILLQRQELESQRESQAKSEDLMALTAKLSALNSLIEATSRKLNDMRARRDSADQIAPVKVELDGYLGQIKTCLNELIAVESGATNAV